MSNRINIALEEIRNLSYKSITKEEKFEMVKTIVSQYDRSDKWFIAFHVFLKTRLKKLVTRAYLNDEITKLYLKNDCTFDYKVDMVISYNDQYKNSVDVLEIVQEVFGADYLEFKKAFDFREQELLCKINEYLIRYQKEKAINN